MRQMMHRRPRSSGLRRVQSVIVLTRISARAMDLLHITQKEHMPHRPVQEFTPPEVQARLPGATRHRQRRTWSSAAVLPHCPCPEPSRVPGEMVISSELGSEAERAPGVWIGNQRRLTGAEPGMLVVSETAGSIASQKDAASAATTWITTCSCLPMRVRLPIEFRSPRDFRHMGI